MPSTGRVHTSSDILFAERCFPHRPAGDHSTLAPTSRPPRTLTSRSPPASRTPPSTPPASGVPSLANAPIDTNYASFDADMRAAILKLISEKHIPDSFLPHTRQPPPPSPDADLEHNMPAPPPPRLR